MIILNFLWSCIQSNCKEKNGQTSMPNQTRAHRSYLLAHERVVVKGIRVAMTKDQYILECTDRPTNRDKYPPAAASRPSKVLIRSVEVGW